MNKLKIAIASVGASALGLLVTVQAHAAALSTSTVGTAIDSVSSNWYDMFLVFLDKAWPFVLGASVLVGAVALAMALIHKLFPRSRR